MAISQSVSVGNPDASLAHLLLVLFNQPDGHARPLLAAVGVDPLLFIDRVRADVAHVVD